MRAAIAIGVGASRAYLGVRFQLYETWQKPWLQ